MVLLCRELKCEMILYDAHKLRIFFLTCKKPTPFTVSNSMRKQLWLSAEMTV